MEPVPLPFQNTESHLQAALHGAAFASLTDRAFLRVTGSDAARWLNGMVTNTVAPLKPGEGNYNFLLNAQGRIQGDALLFRDTNPAESAEFLLVTDAPQSDALQTHLDRFIIMDDVELTPTLTEASSLLLLGPEATRHLAALDLPNLDPLRLAHADTPHGPVLLFTTAPSALPRHHLRASAQTISALSAKLLEAGVPDIGADTLEQLRILEGIPRFGTDIRDRELPQETNQTHALHFAKGCYLGQEIVERIRSRGQVHRVFTAFRLQGEMPTLPAALEAEGKAVGELTSAVTVPLEGGPELLALGYCRREALEKHLQLTYPGGTVVTRILP